MLARSNRVSVSRRLQPCPVAPVQIREGNRVALVGIGAAAVKHMVKAYVAARKYVADDGLDLNSTSSHS